MEDAYNTLRMMRTGWRSAGISFRPNPGRLAASRDWLMTHHVGWILWLSNDFYHAQAPDSKASPILRVSNALTNREEFLLEPPRTPSKSAVSSISRVLYSLGPLLAASVDPADDLTKSLSDRLTGDSVISPIGDGTQFAISE